MAEFAYEVSAREVHTSGSGTNSLVDLLPLDENNLLALEREWPDDDSVSPSSRNVKIFQINLEDATDVKDLASLDGATFDAANKTLLLDLDEVVAEDNGVDRILSYETITFGPTLDDGRQVLLMINDNDNSRDHQVLAFAASPVPLPAAFWLLATALAGALGCKRWGGANAR